MKDKLRMMIRRLRNVYTGEMEDELSTLSVDYFKLHDKHEDLKEELEAVKEVGIQKEITNKDFHRGMRRI
jgi:hypothetical protein